MNMNQSEALGESDRPVSATVSSREVATELGVLCEILPASLQRNQAAFLDDDVQHALYCLAREIIRLRHGTEVLVAEMQQCIESLECAANDLSEVQFDAKEREKQADSLADTAFAARKAIARVEL